jgi:hypothetical protein
MPIKSAPFPVFAGPLSHLRRPREGGSDASALRLQSPERLLQTRIIYLIYI